MLIEGLVFWGRSSGLRSQGGATKEAGPGEAEGGRTGSASAVALPVHRTEGGGAGSVPIVPHVCARTHASLQVGGTGAQGGTAVVTEGLGLDPAATVCQPCDLVRDVSHR